jgi:hypothetical protein
MNSPLRFAVNTHGCNKNWDFRTLSGKFCDRQGTLADVIHHVQQGHALCAGLLGGKWRSKSAFIGSHWVLIDIDNSTILHDESGQVLKDEDGNGIKVYEHQLAIDEAIAHPFIRQHCALIYTTASHRADWHKFRLVFPLPEFISDIDTYEAVVKLLLAQLPHDPSCKDGVRVFYGNTAAEFPLVNPAARLPQDWTQQAIAMAEAAKLEQQAREAAIALKREQYRRLAVEEGWNTDELISQALSFIPPRTVGGGNYDECRQVLMALADHYGPSDAEVIAEQWSPSIAGTTWNIRQKLKSFRRGGISIGTLFHIAQQYGFRFPARRDQANVGEPDHTAYNAYCTWETEQERVEAAQVKEYEPTAREQAKQRDQVRRSKWQAETERIQAEFNSLRIQPTIEAQGRYIQPGALQLPERSGIILVDGQMGCGKTQTALKEMVKQHRLQYPDAFRGLFVPRNMLGLQSGRELGLPHHSHIRGFGIPNEITMCVESSGKLPPDRLPKLPPLVLGDEISQTLKQILDGETCRSNHAFVLNRWRELLRYVADQGGWIVLSEDGLTNLELDFIQQSSGLNVIEFFKFTQTGAAARDYTLYDAASATWSEIKNRLFTGENLVLASDSNKWLRETEQMAIAEGILASDIYIIDSQSAEEPWAKEFAADPDAFVAKHKPRIIGYSPSVNSGVSITDRDGHFSAMALHLVHLEPRAAKQLPDRLRSDVPRFGYVKERGASSDSLYSNCRPDLILRDLYRNVEGVAKLTQFAHYAAEKQSTDRDGNAIDIIGAMNVMKAAKGDLSSDYGFYLHHWSRYRAREAYGKLNLRANLIAIWQQQGHNVELLETGDIKPLAEQRRCIRSNIDREEAIALAAADTSALLVNEARDVQQNLGSTIEQRRAARKRLLEDKLPGCDLSNSDFLLKTVVQEDGRFLKAAELLWLAQNPEAAKLIDRWNWSGAFSQAAKRNKIVWLPKLSNRSAQAKLLNECPLLPFIDGKVEQWCNSSPEAIAVHQWAVLQAPQLRRHLRLTVEESHEPVKTVNKLLRKLGYEPKQCGWVGRTRTTKGDRLYVISNREDTDRNAILAALSERFLKRCEDKGESVEQTSVIATRIDISPATSCDHGLNDWLSDDALADVKMWHEAAQSDPTDPTWGELLSIVPRQVLKRAIA